MIRIVEAHDQAPICPYCETELDQVLVKKLESALGVRFLYFCGDCRKVLGVSHRKGFWMG